jgi:glycosyltransferase involved in cell wall biosynthesis
LNVLILAAGRHGPDLASRIAEGREPRLDVFELERRLGAEVLDFRHVDGSRDAAVRAARGALGPSAALAVLGASRAEGVDVVFTTGEDIGIPLAALLLPRRRAPAHAMIAHTLAPAKKAIFFRALHVHRAMDVILTYSTTEERHAIERLGIPAETVRRITYHADDRFFRPLPDVSAEPNLVSAAGQLLRDYDGLVEATLTLPVKVRIAAASPWIDRPLAPTRPLPPNVEWRRYGRYELRELYARSALCVVPLVENPFQAGISTILEMMAMEKCVVVTRTRGQTDTIVDGETGVYVPPGDPDALRETISRLLAAPDEAARIGRAARAYVEKHAGLDQFTDRLVDAVQAARARKARA